MKKPSTAHKVELRIGLDAVAPTYIPSQVNAAQPIIGIGISQGINSMDAVTTSVSDVST